MAGSGIEPRVLTPATRPLQHVFQAELSELEPLLEQPREAALESVDGYLRRVESIKKRWLELDAQGIVGLRDLLDDAVEKAYLKLRSLDADPTEAAGKQVRRLIDKVYALASAQSLRERADEYRKELDEAASRLCTFCKTEKPDYDKSVVITGKKETGRKSKFLSGTTIYYNLRYKLMFRCARCARFHDFIGRVGFIGGLGSLVGLGILSYNLVGRWLFETAGESSGRAAVALFLAGLAALVLPAWAFATVLSQAFSVATAPSSHQKKGHFKDHAGAVELKKEGYQVTADWRSDALSHIKKGS
jgi:hypothetical protein